MPVPVHRLSKAELVKMATSYCKHGHTYVDHYSCYVRDEREKQKVGFLDIEASNLSADFGIMLCYCIKDAQSERIDCTAVTAKDLKTHLDKAVVKQCVADMLKYDVLVGYYSTKFDIPYIRTRAMVHGIEFPEYDCLRHKDVYYIIKHKFKLSSNRLEKACRSLLGDSDKTHLDPIIWIKALQGDQGSIKYIVDHCEKDVLDLEKLYNKVVNFSSIKRSSI